MGLQSIICVMTLISLTFSNLRSRNDVEEAGAL